MQAPDNVVNLPKMLEDENCIEDLCKNSMESRAALCEKVGFLLRICPARKDLLRRKKTLLLSRTLRRIFQHFPPDTVL